MVRKDPIFEARTNVKVSSEPRLTPPSTYSIYIHIYTCTRFQTPTETNLTSSTPTVSKKKPSAPKRPSNPKKPKPTKP